MYVEIHNEHTSITKYFQVGTKLARKVLLNDIIENKNSYLFCRITATVHDELIYYTELLLPCEFARLKNERKMRILAELVAINNCIYHNAGFFNISTPKIEEIKYIYSPSPWDNYIKNWGAFNYLHNDWDKDAHTLVKPQNPQTITSKYLADMADVVRATIEKKEQLMSTSVKVTEKDLDMTLREVLKPINPMVNLEPIPFKEATIRAKWIIK